MSLDVREGWNPAAACFTVTFDSPAKLTAQLEYCLVCERETRSPDVSSDYEER